MDPPRQNVPPLVGLRRPRALGSRFRNVAVVGRKMKEDGAPREFGSSDELCAVERQNSSPRVGKSGIWDHLSLRFKNHSYNEDETPELRSTTLAPSSPLGNRGDSGSY